jgi:hypothetical protein
MPASARLMPTFLLCVVLSSLTFRVEAQQARVGLDWKIEDAASLKLQYEALALELVKLLTRPDPPKKTELDGIKSAYAELEQRRLGNFNFKGPVDSQRRSNLRNFTNFPSATGNEMENYFRSAPELELKPGRFALKSMIPFNLLGRALASKDDDHVPIYFVGHLLAFAAPLATSMAILESSNPSMSMTPIFWGSLAGAKAIATSVFLMIQFANYDPKVLSDEYQLYVELAHLPHRAFWQTLSEQGFPAPTDLKGANFSSDFEREFLGVYTDSKLGLELLAHEPFRSEALKRIDAAWNEMSPQVTPAVRTMFESNRQKFNEGRLNFSGYIEVIKKMHDTGLVPAPLLVLDKPREWIQSIRSTSSPLFTPKDSLAAQFYRNLDLRQRQNFGEVALHFFGTTGGSVPLSVDVKEIVEASGNRSGLAKIQVSIGENQAQQTLSSEVCHDCFETNRNVREAKILEAAQGDLADKLNTLCKSMIALQGASRP